MIDPRLAWFAMGATFGMVLCGWPWHPRFSRYTRPAPRWQTLPPPPAPGTRRVYINSPATMAECGGPCSKAMDPRACDCGALWVDVPLASSYQSARFRNPRLGVPWDEGSTQRGHSHGGATTPKPEIIPKPQPSGGRLVRGDRLDPTFRPDWSPCSQPPNSGGYQPRPQGGTPTPPPKSP